MGLLVGVRVDTGAIPTPSAIGETVTGGLVGLEARVSAYRALGVRFTRWRAVFRVGDDPRTPTRRVVEMNATSAARCAAISQASGLVPVIEMDVLTDGSHGPGRCAEATSAIHRHVLEQLTLHGVRLESVVLVSSPVIAGLGHPVQSCSGQLAMDTAEVLNALPESLGGVLVSVGRRPTHQAGPDLAAVQQRRPGRPTSFFVGRSVTVGALSVWQGDPAKHARAQHTVGRRLGELATMSLSSGHGV